MPIQAPRCCRLGRQSVFKFSFTNNWFLFILQSVRWSLSSSKKSSAVQLQHARVVFCIHNIFLLPSLWCLIGTFLCTDTTWGGERIACAYQAEQYFCLPHFLTRQVEIGALMLPQKGGWFWAVAYSSLSQLPRGLQAGPLLLLLLLRLNKHRVVFVIA